MWRVRRGGIATVLRWYCDGIVTVPWRYGGGIPTVFPTVRQRQSRKLTGGSGRDFALIYLLWWDVNGRRPFPFVFVTSFAMGLPEIGIGIGAPWRCALPNSKNDGFRITKECMQA